MKKDIIKFISVIALSVLFIWGVVYAANTFPTTLNDWEDGDIIESDWADSIEAKVGITGSTVKTSLDYKTTVNIELQGTASASYLLVGNTMQINGFASVAYSRFGTNTTTGSFLSGANDLLITGKFEVDSSSSFDGGLKGSGLTNCNGTSNKLVWFSGGAKFGCETDATGSVASNSLNFDEFQNPLVLDLGITTTSASFPWNWGATSFLNVGTASFSKWINVGGVAGVRIDGDGDGALTLLGLGNGSDEDATLNLDDTANTGVWSSTTGLNKFDFGAIGLELNQDVALTLGANTGLHDGTTFVFNDDAVFSTGAGSSSFAGSLNITKGLVANNFSGAGLANCNATNNYLAWSLGGSQFICDTTDDAFIPDGITVSGGTLGANNISSGVTWTTLGTLTIGDNGDRLDFDTSGWDITNSVFAGLTGLTSTGVIDFGGATSFEIVQDGTVNATGEMTVNTASNSLDWYNGTRIVVDKEEYCFTYVVDSPTAANPGRVQGKRFNDPFTITSVQPVASGSNAAGWNLLYGVPGTVTTSVFTLAKSASTSTYPTYTSFANSTVLNNNNLDLIITSRSAVLQTFSVNVCGRDSH